MRPRSSPAAVLALAALALAAGCGGQSKYSAEKSRACLDSKPGVRVEQLPPSDFVATTALAGAFSVRFRDNFVTLAFGDDRDEARRLTDAYVKFKGKNIGIEDVLRPVKNVVVLWEAHPSDDEIATIQDCLK